MFLAMDAREKARPQSGVDVVREVIVQAMATGEIPSRDADPGGRSGDRHGNAAS